MGKWFTRLRGENAIVLRSCLLRRFFYVWERWIQLVAGLLLDEEECGAGTDSHMLFSIIKLLFKEKKKPKISSSKFQKLHFILTSTSIF